MKTIFRVEGVTREMQEKTNEKFNLWDKIVKENWIISEDPKKQEKAYKLLADPTIYAYAFFKDPKDTEKPIKLYPYQDMIINDPHRFIYFNAANQIGKSITLCILAIHHAVMNPGHIVLMTSKTFTQSKDLMRQIKQFLKHCDLDYKFNIGETETKTELSLKHFDTNEDGSINELPESRIICTPTTEAALGYAVNLALADELNFCDDGEHFFFQILQPRTYTTKGRIVVFSNPNGQQGIGWKLYNDDRFHTYTFNFLDCPTNTQEEFEQYAKSLTQEKIDSTLLAKFTAPEGGFFTLQERKAMQVDRPNYLPQALTQPVYIFFDWAKSKDRTVRIIARPQQQSKDDWAPAVEIIEMKEYPSGTKYSDIIEGDLQELVHTLTPQMIAMVGWDNTGVGRGLEDFVDRVQQFGIQAMPVEFTLQNKSRIYTLFKLLAEQRRITMPFVEECDRQLSKLIFKRTARGLLQVHHEQESDRDDYPDAIAGVASLIIQPANVPVTATII